MVKQILSDRLIECKATGNSRESRTPKIPGGNSREFLKFWRELRGIYMSFVLFPIFIVDYDISV